MRVSDDKWRDVGVAVALGSVLAIVGVLAWVWWVS